MKQLAVHDAETGAIRFILRVKDCDAKLQKAPAGHCICDVTGCVDAHPERHQVDIKTGTLVPRVFTIDELRAKTKRRLDMELEIIEAKANNGHHLEAALLGGPAELDALRAHRDRRVARAKQLKKLLVAADKAETPEQLSQLTITEG